MYSLWYGKFSPDHNCKATKFYQEEAKTFVKSSEFKQLKSNKKISLKILRNRRCPQPIREVDLCENQIEKIRKETSYDQPQER